VIRTLVCIVGLLASGPALALSCIAPSVERSFDWASASEESYVIVHGRLTVDEIALPRGGNGEFQPPEMTKVPAILLGKSLNLDGFKVPFDQEITLEVACFGPWCGSVRNGEDVLAFVRKDGARYAMGVNPCGGTIFSAPSRKLLKTVKACLRGGACAAD
jgi:hypothetical protein